jgi:hypothetical protein
MVRCRLKREWLVARGCRGLCDELYRREDARPLLVADDEDDAAPPFSWVDGHGGLGCRAALGLRVPRRSLGLGRERGRHGQAVNLDAPDAGEVAVAGFAFWDRARVELLKRGMPEYAMRWLKAALPSEGWLRETWVLYYAKLSAHLAQRGRRSAPVGESAGLSL